MAEDPDELFVFDAERLSLLQASARRGHLCSQCHSVLTLDDQALLLVIADEYVKQQERFRVGKAAFGRALEQACRLVNRGYLPFSPPPADPADN